MANIVYISKYPPLEGGIAAKTFWLVRALACAGHTVHLVTDPLNVDAVYSIPASDHPPDIPGVIVHRANNDVPWHIPNQEYRGISLLDRVLGVIAQQKPDFIVGGYLVPYGIVAFQASQITGIPYVLFHGGSDVNKFLLKNIWPNIIPNTLKAASVVFTDRDNHAHIKRLTDRIKILPPYVPDPSAFFRQPRLERDKFTLALIGKTNYFWRHKGWQKVINLWSLLGKEFKFTVVSQGVGLEDFKNSVSKELQSRIVWQPFVPPWKMPTLLCGIDGVFHLVNQLPFPMFSNIFLESLNCGTTVITDSQYITDHFLNHGIALDNTDENILSLNFDDPEAAGAELTKYIKKEKHNAFWDCSSVYNQYFFSIERLCDQMSCRKVWRDHGDALNLLT